MPRQSPLTRFKSILKSRRSAAAKAELVVQLAPQLPEAAFAVMDDAMPAADPLVQVALMDAYFEMTDDRYYEEDLERMLEIAQAQGDDGEELYMAARLALGRLNGRPIDALDGTGLTISAVRTRDLLAAPRPRDRVTIIIHGTWAADGKWWRPRGDFLRGEDPDVWRKERLAEFIEMPWS